MSLLAILAKIFSASPKKARVQSLRVIVSVSARTPPLASLASSLLLREATSRKGAKDFVGAIECLRKAYEAIETEGISHPIATYLRLPMMLNLAGHRDEAWAEYNRLLTHPRLNDSELIPMDQSAIYSRMCLQLKREGHQVGAVKFAALSIVCWGIGLARQGRTEELRDWSGSESIEQEIMRPLRMAGKIRLLAKVSAVIQAALLDPRACDIGKVSHEIEAAVTEQSSGM